MMKRAMSLLCILLLCLTTMAYAETHTISVWLDEDAIDVTMERWESTLGVTMSYDPVHFAPSTETPDTIRFLDDEHAYICFLSVTDKSMDERWTAWCFNPGRMMSKHRTQSSAAFLSMRSSALRNTR